MPLNPELVTQILSECGQYFQGDWLRAQTEEIQTKAGERGSTPDIFVHWLMSRWFFKATEELDHYQLRELLVQQLTPADQMTISESIATRQHAILFIESNKVQPGLYKDSLKIFGGNRFGIPRKNIIFHHREYPPRTEKQFSALLEAHTGIMLHNLSLPDLDFLKREIDRQPALTKKMVVVKTGDIITQEYAEAYQELEDRGVMLVRKPYNIEPTVRVMFGLI